MSSVCFCILCSESQESENPACDNEDIQPVFCNTGSSYMANDNQAAQGINIRATVRHNVHSLTGEVKGPAPPTVLAKTRSAICLRASRPVGLLPLVSWSWISPSNSSLNTCSQNKQTKTWADWGLFQVAWCNVTRVRSDERQTQLYYFINLTTSVNINEA